MHASKRSPRRMRLVHWSPRGCRARIHPTPSSVFRRDLLRAQAGDHHARQRVVEANLNLVHHVVRRYRGVRQDMEDLFQVGCVGLVKAVDRFDPDRGTQFSTYAVPLILGEVQRYLRDDAPASAGRNAYQTVRRAGEARDRHVASFGTEPSVSAIAQALGIPTAELIAAMESARAPLSLDDPGSGPDSVPLLERLAGPTGEMDHALLRALIRQLPRRERQVLLLRYFLDRSQIEAAEAIGLSQPQISRIERRALDSLRRMWHGEPPA